MPAKIKVTRKGKPVTRPSLIMNEAYMRTLGARVAAPARAALERGHDVTGAPLPPEAPTTAGNGIPGFKTGALAASIAPRVTKKGVLMVMPDYRKFRYGIYLTVGVNTEATKKAIASGKLRKRRDYKGEGDRYQVPRPWMGMNGTTLAGVEQANVTQFRQWFDGLLGTAKGQAGKATVDGLPGAVRR